MVHAARKVRLKRRVGKIYYVSTAEPAAEREYKVDYIARSTRLNIVDADGVVHFPLNMVDADGVVHFPLNTGKETAVC